MNLAWGIDDFKINMILMLLGKATTMSMSVLPMTILMMEVVPKNIEASMFAMITAIITVSVDCLGNIVGGLVCDVFGITNTNMTHFGHAVIYKQIVIIFAMMLVYILPTKREVTALVERMEQQEKSVEDQIAIGSEFRSFMATD